MLLDVTSFYDACIQIQKQNIRSSLSLITFGICVEVFKFLGTRFVALKMHNFLGCPQFLEVMMAVLKH